MHHEIKLLFNIAARGQQGIPGTITTWQEIPDYREDLLFELSAPRPSMVKSVGPRESSLKSQVLAGEYLLKIRCHRVSLMRLRKGLAKHPARSG